MRLKIIFLSCLGVLFATAVSAHGGVQQHVGDVHVTLLQQPLSPLIDEPVSLSFVLSTESGTTLANTPFTIRIIESPDNDARHDREVYKQSVTSDVNGVYTFKYTFPEPVFYDIALDLPASLTGQTEITGSEHAIGFLIQPRDATVNGYPFYKVGMAMLIGIGVGIGIMQTRKALQTP